MARVTAQDPRLCLYYILLCLQSRMHVRVSCLCQSAGQGLFSCIVATRPLGAQVPIATSAAAITLEHEGYVVEPAIDFNQQAGYLSIAKAHDRFAFKGSYAFKEARAPPACRDPPVGGAAAACGRQCECYQIESPEWEHMHITCKRWL